MAAARSLLCGMGRKDCAYGTVLSAQMTFWAGKIILNGTGHTPEEVALQRLLVFLCEHVEPGEQLLFPLHNHTHIVIIARIISAADRL